MIDKFEFTPEERSEALQLISELKERLGGYLLPGDEQKIRSMLRLQTEQKQLTRDAFGLNPVVTGLQTAMILVDETGLKRDAVVTILLYNSVVSGLVAIDDVRQDYGESVARIMHGLCRIQELYKNNHVIES